MSIAHAQDPLRDRSREFLWVFPAALPFLIIFLSYVFQTWSWGLMDDLSILNSGAGVGERFTKYFSGLCSWGVFRPTFAAHAAAAYTAFEQAPGLFHVLKWLEILVTLGVWGRAAWRLTGVRAALFLLPAVAMSFHFLYDQFFFLSTHETFGLLFFGLALNVLLGLVLGEKQQGAWVRVLGAGVLLLAAFGAKETFVACGIALGAALCVSALGQGRPRKEVLAAGAVFLGASLVYGIVLKLFLSHGYTADYRVLDVPKLSSNLMSWAGKDLLNHIPWVLALAGVLVSTGGRPRWRELPRGERFGLVLGACLYLFFLGILLPWNTTTYYAGPLGVFFAFCAAVLIARRLEALSFPRLFALVLFATVCSVFMSSYTLHREAAYHQDTQDLWQWIRGSGEFRRAAREGKVFCNAMEPSDAIPGHANRWWGLGLKSFVWRPDINAAGRDGADYYIQSPRFGDISEAALQGWEVVFYSPFWKVYQKKL